MPVVCHSGDRLVSLDGGSRHGDERRLDGYRSKGTGRGRRVRHRTKAYPIPRHMGSSAIRAATTFHPRAETRSALGSYRTAQRDGRKRQTIAHLRWGFAVTVRVTMLKGVAAGYYYLEGGGLCGYYLGDGEPAGRWWGRAAPLLGLDGPVEDQAFLDVMAGVDPRTGRDLGRRFGEGSVRGFDATFSAPKSVSVLFAFADPELRRHVVEAHDRAVEAVVGWVESHAHTRLPPPPRGGRCRHGRDRGGVVPSAHQPGPRPPAAHPRRHRQPGPDRDGRWLALDARHLRSTSAPSPPSTTPACVPS